MQISLNQVAPLDANAGLQQSIVVDQTTPGSVPNAASGSALTSSTPGTALGVSYAVWLFAAAVLYYLFLGGKR